LLIGKDSPQLSQILEMEGEGFDRMYSVGLISGEDELEPIESFAACTIFRSIHQAPVQNPTIILSKAVSPRSQ
jgi:hypothetical protein